ncbi:hypothetical protein [Blastococcus colisei]|uniref:hypothetical protein n=1 Tax=Blastococcus colisei TaxID=1564162 RepID=UPI00114F934D|nr:hypothetical protein [Blastococcus colisei]
MLEWNDLDPHRLERVVQMLLRDELGDSVTAIDGAGGDEAQDMRWDSPDGLVIFEVKSFCGRLVTSQRRQVKRSLARAVNLHAPTRWVLITRSVPTPKELAWLTGLIDIAPGVALEWWGRDWLDRRIAGRHDLISYIEGETYGLLERARQFNMEQAVLASGDDLSQRLDALLERGDEISPYWRWEFSSGPRGRMRTLMPRHPEAPVDDPISITPTFYFPADDPEARDIADRLRETLEVGGEVAIPGRYVSRFDVVAASEATQRLLGDDDRAGDLELLSIPVTQGFPLQASLTLQPSTADRPAVTLPVTFTRRVGGSHGSTMLGADASDALAVRLVLREDGTVRGQLHVTLRSVAGRRPHEVLPALQFLATLQPGDRLTLCAGPAELGGFQADTTWPDDLGPLCRLVGALVALQRHLRTLIPIPTEELSQDVVRDLLSVADALSGERAQLPYTALSAKVVPGGVPRFLASIAEAGGALYITHSAEFVLDGRSYTVSGLATYAPRIRLANRAELAANRNSPGEQVAWFEPVDDEHWYLIRSVLEHAAADDGFASAG